MVDFAGRLTLDPKENTPLLEIRACFDRPSSLTVGDKLGRCQVPERAVNRRQGPWRHVEAVEFATLAWVDWFNTRRLLAPLGHVPPIEYERAYYERHATPAMEAGLN